ncbi:MAG TPA: exodeoxyribonuclease VII large subunit [Candidatus Deferrimicrobium sp.]|nr:exodeoxyribonuclease VII large subunit [Candidatus Deferrimicrobium sp.]
MKWVSLTVNGVEVSVAFDENSIHIYNAYTIKDDLKLRGYRWNPSDKSWLIRPGDEADVISEIEKLKKNIQSSTTAVPAITIKRSENTPKQSEKTELAKFPDSYSVADLRNRIDRLIREGIRGNTWVRGVIASDVKNYQWASYLDLKDEDEKLDIFFRVEIKKINLEKINRRLKESGVAQSLEKDLPVFCNVEVYLPLRNVIDVRLCLLDILPEYTQAKIRNQREITLDKLKEEGILENQKKMLMPVLISRIGLITSGQGTSIRDINAGLYPYGNKYRFFFVDSRMEGAKAVDMMIQALDFLENHAGIKPDAIVIARGGGSEQSLAVFNDLRLCRRVCLARVPILTAIGHEKDVSAIEQCSWLTPTPATPSGIGKYLQERYVKLQEQLSSSVTRLIHHFTNVHHREMEKINAFLKNIPARTAGNIRQREERFFSRLRGLEQSVTYTVRDQGRRIAVLSRQLLEKIRDIHFKNKKNIEISAAAVLSRTITLNRKEVKQVEKTISKLDFEKRRRDSRKQQEEIRRKARNLLTQALKNLNDAQKDLAVRRQLVQANDPQNILEKGFSLTLDEANRVIKSLHEFEQKESAILKFHDGAARVKKETEKDMNKINKEEI